MNMTRSMPRGRCLVKDHVRTPSRSWGPGLQGSELPVVEDEERRRAERAEGGRAGTGQCECVEEAETR